MREVQAFVEGKGIQCSVLSSSKQSSQVLKQALCNRFGLDPASHELYMHWPPQRIEPSIDVAFFCGMLDASGENAGIHLRPSTNGLAKVPVFLFPGQPAKEVKVPPSMKVSEIVSLALRRYGLWAKDPSTLVPWASLMREAEEDNQDWVLCDEEPLSDDEKELLAGSQIGSFTETQRDQTLQMIDSEMEWQEVAEDPGLDKCLFLFQEESEALGLIQANGLELFQVPDLFSL
mmetsp:Transcript_3948/g.6196  ORF Transcript_3948/g.6196 Transcript_3948/m.6196 type:complete len:232 (-) Transcript_3948:117-812(-)